MAEQKTPAKNKAVVVVDPLSTGAALAKEVVSRGWPCVRLYSKHHGDNVTHLAKSADDHGFLATITHDGNMDNLLRQLAELPAEIAVVMAGSEPGVELSDHLSAALSLPTSNGIALTKARLDKYVMGETVREAGVRAVQQARVSNLDEVKAFVARLQPEPFRVILKPVQSAGSDGVALCKSMEELEEAFKRLVGSHNALGLANEVALCQEYLAGQEYVVDMVSSGGQHKCIAVWTYDKRPANGAPFVYFGMRVVPASDPVVKELIEYQLKVVTALGIKYGPTHGEVMYTKTGPCLVEVGSRPHGAGATFVPMVNYAIGYNQVQATVDAYLFPEEFLKKYGDIPAQGQGFAKKVDLVSFHEGKVKEIRHLDEIRRLPSFLEVQYIAKVGDVIPKTVDCFSQVGSIALVHVDEEQLNKDYEAIRGFEQDMFIVD